MAARKRIWGNDDDMMQAQGTSEPARNFLLDTISLVLVLSQTGRAWQLRCFDSDDCVDD